jgi:hypothetical protein
MAEYVLQEVGKESLDKLEAFNFTVVEEEYSPKSFGNSYAILQNQSLRIMLIRDRSQIMLQVAPLSETEEWLHLSDLLELLGSPDREILDLSTSNPNPDQVMKCVLKNYPEVSTALAPDNLGNTKARLEVLRAKRRANTIVQ